MIVRPPRSTRTDSLFPDTTVCRSLEAAVAVERAHRLGEDHVVAGRDIGHLALDRRVDALRRGGVGPRHDHEAGVGARIDRRFHSIDHLALRHHLLARAMAAALLPDLVLHVHGGPADALEVTDRSDEHTSELQSLMRISYAVFSLKKQIY